MAYIIKKGSGGGGGDATAFNQDKQIDQLLEGSSSSSVFKDNSDNSAFIDRTGESAFISSTGSTLKDSNGNSVFTDISGLSVFKTDTDISILYRACINTGLVVGSRNNTLQCIVFTAASAVNAVAALNVFLNNNGVIINSLTSSQSVGSHDLFLLYSTL